MPRINPIIAGEQVNGPINAPRASAASFGGEVGTAMAGFGNALGDLGQVLRKREAEAETSLITRRLAEEEARATVEWNETLQKADPNDKELASRFNESLSSRLAEIGEGVESSAARMKFAEASTKMRSQFFVSTMQGQAQLSGIAEKEHFEATHNARTTSVYNNPSMFADKIRDSEMELEERVVNGRLPRAVAEQLKNSTRAELAMSALRGTINVMPDMAEQQLKSGQFDLYLDAKMKDQMFGEIESQRRANQVQEAARIAAVERANKARQELTQQELLEDLLDGKLTVNKIRASNLDAVGGAGSKKAFIDMLEEHNKGGTVKTNPDTYYMLHSMATTPELRDQFLKTDIVTYKKDLSREDMISLIKLQGNVRKGDQKALGNIRSTQKVANDTLDQAGIRDKTKRALFNRALEEDIEEFQQQNGRAPNSKERREIADKLISVKDKGWFSDTYTFEAGKKDRGTSIAAEPTVEDIPKADRKRIEAYLKFKKFKVTDETILRLFKTEQAIKAQKSGR